MRLFAALEIDEKNRKKIAKLQEHFKGSSLKGIFVRKNNFHVTLKFLGETEPEMIKRICFAMDSSVSAVNKFILQTGEVGYFKRRDGLILWLGIIQGSEEVWTISSNLNEELFKTGFKKEDIPFTPHITLARRVKLRKSFDIITDSFRSDKISVDIIAVTLFESRREKGVLVYDPIYRSPLN
jgi:2'-5' RNA ligase